MGDKFKERISEVEKMYTSRLNRPYWISWTDHLQLFLKMQRLCEYLEQIIKITGWKKLNILDVGCADGATIVMLNQFFENKIECSFSGIDSASETISAANIWKDINKITNVEFHIDDSNNLLFKDNSFDIIICLELLEHLKVPKKTLENIYRVLKPGGYAIISTPSGIGFQVLMKTFFQHLHRLRKTWSSWDNMSGKVDITTLRSKGYGHISIKKPTLWWKIFKEIGFVVEKTKSSGTLVYGGGWLDRHYWFFSFLCLLGSLLSIIPRGNHLAWDCMFLLKRPAQK